MITELFNMSYLSTASGVDYGRLRSNLLSRKEKVRLTKDEKAAILKTAKEGIENLKEFLS